MAVTRDDVWAADPLFTSNADILRACFKLGWLDVAARTIDPCSNRGAWWAHGRPDELVCHDLDPVFGDGVDVRALPHEDRSFSRAAYDPPYCPAGGAATSSIGDHLARYGRGHNLPTVDMKSPASVQQLYRDGLTELARVTTDYILAKGCDYTWNGQHHAALYDAQKHAESLGLVAVDRLLLVGTPGPQPKRSVCLHCGEPIQWLAGEHQAWSDYKRPKGYVKGDGIRSCTAAAHVPDPEAETQQHAAINYSVLTVYRCPGAEGPEPPASLF